MVSRDGLDLAEVPVDLFLEDGFFVVLVELADEHVLDVSLGVGTAAGLEGGVLGEVFHLAALVSPIALPAAILLDLVGRLVGETGLAKVLGDLLPGGGTFGLGVVGDVVVLVGTSHGRGVFDDGCGNLSG